MRKTLIQIKRESGLRVGMEVVIRKRKGKTFSKRKEFRGEIIEIPNDSNFDVHNGMWRESFSFKDIGIGFDVQVVPELPTLTA